MRTKPRMRWAAPSRRFEVTYGEVALFVLFLALLVAFGLRDWIASQYIAAIAERMARIESSMVPFQEFLARRGAPDDILGELRRDLDASTVRLEAYAAVNCAVLKRVGGDMRVCASLTPTPRTPGNAP